MTMNATEHGNSSNKKGKRPAELSDLIDARVTNFIRKQSIQLINRAKQGKSAFALDADDLYQEGLIAAWLATESYDPTANSHFLCYAYKRIFGAMVDHLRLTTGLLRSGKLKFNYVDTRHDGNRTEEIHEEIEDDSKPEPCTVQFADLMEFLSSEELPKRTQEMFLDFYFSGLTHKEIGNKNRISSRRVFDIFNLTKMRMKRQCLKRNLDIHDLVSMN